jgi:Uri superfamily endonuclease
MIRKGSYILILDIPAVQIRIGALGIVNLREGTYCYVGSAMNGLDQRIKRHLSREKKLRWHIDHLTIVCSRAEAYEAAYPGITECELGRIAGDCGGTYAVKGFGCSDCRCPTHLFLLEGDAKEKLLSRPYFMLHSQQSIRG